VLSKLEVKSRIPKPPTPVAAECNPKTSSNARFACRSRHQRSYSYSNSRDLYCM
jgi:hypothetical protein